MIAPDTSVVVAAISPWHELHRVAREAVAGRDAQLVAHVAVETVSTLSRMPETHRVPAPAVLEVLRRSFPHEWLALDRKAMPAALATITDAGISGGAIYDALIATVADASGTRLVSADRRAAATYDRLGVAYTLLG